MKRPGCFHAELLNFEGVQAQDGCLEPVRYAPADLKLAKGNRPAGGKGMDYQKVFKVYVFLTWNFFGNALPLFFRIAKSRPSCFICPGAPDSLGFQSKLNTTKTILWNPAFFPLPSKDVAMNHDHDREEALQR